MSVYEIFSSIEKHADFLAENTIDSHYAHWSTSRVNHHSKRLIEKIYESSFPEVDDDDNDQSPTFRRIKLMVDSLKILLSDVELNKLEIYKQSVRLYRNSRRLERVFEIFLQYGNHSFVEIPPPGHPLME